MPDAPSEKDQRPVGVASYQEVIDAIGFGLIHFILLFVCGLLNMCVLSETMGMAVIVKASQCDLELDIRRKTALLTITLVGLCVSSYMWGHYCDIVGRRKMILYGTFLTNACSVCSSLMPDFWSFLVFRFLTGLCVAAPSCIILTYIAEFCSDRLRPMVINFTFGFNGLNTLYCSCMANNIIRKDWYVPIGEEYEYRPWRVLMLVFTLPGFVGACALLALPESPKFLMAVGRREEAYAALNRIYKINKGQTLEEHNIFQIEEIQQAKPHEKKQKLWRDVYDDMNPLYQRAYLKKFLPICVIMFGLIFICNGMGVWFGEMRTRVNLVDEQPLDFTTICRTMYHYVEFKEIILDEFVCNDSFRSFREGIIMGSSFSTCYTIIGVLLRWISRKVIFITCLTLTAIMGICLTFVTNKIAIAVIFVTFLVVPAVMISILGSALADFTPTYFRGKAICLCMIFGRLGVVIGAGLVGKFVVTSCTMVFLTFALSAFVCAIIAYWIPL